jgi:arginase
VDVQLIQVPYMAGDDRHGSSEGPRRLLEAGAVEVLAAQGLAVSVESIDRGGPFRDTATSSAAVNKRLAAAVGRAVAAGGLPVVVAGSCAACQGVLAGFEHSRCGVVWLDAHADFNTPESTVTGFFPGMAAAVIAGHCYRDYWAQIGDNTPIAEEAIVMLGVRDLWPEAERRRLERSQVRVVHWRDGRPQGNVRAALDALAERVEQVYLHIDLDVFDPAVAPGIVDQPVPGGLSLPHAEEAVRATAARFRIRAATLATFTPEHDRNDTTLRLALRVIELIGECAVSPGPAARA